MLPKWVSPVLFGLLAFAVVLLVWLLIPSMVTLHFDTPEEAATRAAIKASGDTIIPLPTDICIEGGAPKVISSGVGYAGVLSLTYVRSDGAIEMRTYSYGFGTIPHESGTRIVWPGGICAGGK